MQFASPPPPPSPVCSFSEENSSPSVLSTDIPVTPPQITVTPSTTSKEDDLFPGCTVSFCSSSSDSYSSSCVVSSSSSTTSFSSPDFCNRARRGRGRPRGSRASRPRANRRAMAVATVAWAAQQQQHGQRQQYASALLRGGRPSRLHKTPSSTHSRIVSSGLTGGLTADWPIDCCYDRGECEELEAATAPPPCTSSRVAFAGCSNCLSIAPSSFYDGGSMPTVIPCPPSEDKGLLSATSSQLMYSLVTHAISEDAPTLAIPTFNFSRSVHPSFPSVPPSTSLCPVGPLTICHIDLKAVTNHVSGRMVLELPAVTPLLDNSGKRSRQRAAGGAGRPVLATS
eukprot:GHVS01095985.1.p1 GENE.GHVS01095985.1~~GHVS01095985.1.p1  ORF type:complete len:340 (-),score=60.71 GHVS01095985.1:1627-2646(-)